MHLSFIGMSNIGKSFWSKHLATVHGYIRHDCDTGIEKLLGAELTQQGFRGIKDVAKWMGHPDALQYPQTSARYLACEEQVLRQAVDAIATAPDNDSVIDTTGSIIYLSPELLRDLRARSTVVYLEATEAHKAHMFKCFVAHPKPVIWGESFHPRAGESSADAIKRCYVDLLSDRDRRYRAMAHITVPFSTHKNHAADILDFLKAATLLSETT